MRIETKKVKIQEKEITKIKMINKEGMEVEVLDLGGIITEINVPDKDGKVENVVLGYEELETYLENPIYLGAIIGRTAGRVNKGKMTIGEKSYQLPINDNSNTLHGGVEGFDSKIWNFIVEEEEEYVQIKFAYISEDGEEGYPGNLNVEVTYTLDNNNALTLTYRAVSDQDTLVNLTNHSYFNLSGNVKDTVSDHIVYVNSDKVCKLDEESIPTGEFMDVAEEKAFDFRVPKTVGQDIGEILDTPQLGYDHPWVLNSSAGKAAYYYDPKSGRKMSITTTNKAVVIYTTNLIDKERLSTGNQIRLRDGICFETQALPIGHDECYKEQSILKAGDEYREITTFQFSTK